jgi:HSP90 family molecular chaperone/class 3 adenylate cyclase
MALDKEKMRTKEMAISLENILPSLAKSLYGDDWRISIRELLQNCHDALQDRTFARGETPNIDIIPDPVASTLTFQDNGLGMTTEEVEKYLATVGYGRKREQLEKMKNDNRDDRASLQKIIGQYGIGFLSAFIIAESVEVFSKSAQSPTAKAVHAVFTGETKWYFDEADRFDDFEGPGTKVVVRLKPEPVIDPVTAEKTSLRDLLNFQRLEDEVRRFGDLLPFPINVKRSPSDKTPTLGNAQFGPWERPNCQTHELIAFVQKRHHGENEPLYAEAFEFTTTSHKVEAQGIIYFPSPSREMIKSFESVARVDVFSRRMFIADDIIALLPDWATFVGVVVECPVLTPTLNRNDVIRHEASFVDLKHALADKIVEILTFLAEKKKTDFYNLLAEHTERIYTAALENYRTSRDDEEKFFRAIVPLIPFTVMDSLRQSGEAMTLPEYVEAIGSTRGDQNEKPCIYYLDDPHSMGQYRAMIVQKDIPVVMAIRHGESLLVKAYGSAFQKDLTVSHVRDILNIYVEPIDEAPYEPLMRFLKGLDGGGPDDVSVSKFSPNYVPAIMTIGSADNPHQAKVLEELLAQGGSVLDGKVKKVMEDAVAAARDGRDHVRVILNANNPVIEKVKNHCSSGNVLAGVAGDVLHEIYHNARAVIDSTAAASDHYYEHRSDLLADVLNDSKQLDDVEKKNTRLQLELESKRKELEALVAKVPTELTSRDCALLVTDLRGSSRMVGFLDSAESAKILRDYAARIKRIIEQHGGSVEKFTGDGMFAYFMVSGDDEQEPAQAAAACAFELHGATNEFFAQGEVKKLLRNVSAIHIRGCRTCLHFGSVHYGGIADMPALVGRNVVTAFRAVDKNDLFEQNAIILSESFMDVLQPTPRPQPLKRNVKLDPDLPSQTFYPHPALAVSESE